MLDKSKIGHQFPSFSAVVEKGRLKFFAKAIGETNPIYTDEAAAKKAGHRSLPAPPTFTSALDHESLEFLPVLGVLGIDIGKVLHTNQAFEYFAPIYAGDSIRVDSSVVDIFDKQGGALEFVVIQNRYTNQHGELTAMTSCTLVVRN